ncbi:MazG family protein [Stomatohabitans albus]|uniref:MazG family protein n=1 Tax=Stomatohabitans albus TaxID=3110766 RepID=UPI00300C9217
MSDHELARTNVILAELLGDQGCPWTKAQTHESLAQYAVEEAYELAEAIASGNSDDIREELGDLWLQVAYHSAIAEDFDSNDVAHTLNEKLIRRHPHVFGQTTVQDAAEVADAWDQIKAEEKSSRTDPFEGVSPKLPPLLMAAKTRWRGRDQKPIPPVSVAVAELVDVVNKLAQDPEMLTPECLGQALGALVTLGVSADIDPDMALRKHTATYQQEVRERYKAQHSS